MLEDGPLKGLVNEIADVLNDAYDSVITTSDISPVMDSYLRNDLLTFSGFKSHAELQEVAAMLRTDDGKIKPFEKFARDVTKVHTDYNVNYLNAEYNFAISSAQMAAKWVEVEADGDRYNLQYRTADDAKVREVHRALHNVTLPPSDPFWDKYYPPNGWGCRCTAVQVRKSKYETSDPEKALADGLASTRQISNGIDKGAIFRFNPGKSRKIMPPKHPYYKVSQSDKKEIMDVIKDLKPVTNQKELEDELKLLSEKTDWFKHGFTHLTITDKSGLNGSTNMKGLISLSANRMESCISGVGKLKRGKDISFEEADAISTLWHEITHNRHNGNPIKMTQTQILRMELANEFVSRNTLPEFYEAIGTKIQHSEFMTSRESTGYNAMVKNYDTMVTLLKIDKAAVVNAVKKSLFEDQYHNQEAGLIMALLDNGAEKQLKKAHLTALVKRTDAMSESKFKELLSSLLIED